MLLQLIYKDRVGELLISMTAMDVYINTAFTWWSESKGDLHLYASGAFDITYNGLTGMWNNLVHVSAPCRQRGE